MFQSEDVEVVLAGLTVDRLKSGDVDTFGALTAAEVVAPVTVADRQVLTGNQTFQIAGCTPAVKNLPNRVEKSCTGQGTLRASGEAAFGQLMPLLLVGDEGTCVGQCQVKTPVGTAPAVATCRLKVCRSGQQAAAAPRTAGHAPAPCHQPAPVAATAPAAALTAPPPAEAAKQLPTSSSFRIRLVGAGALGPSLKALQALKKLKLLKALKGGAGVAVDVMVFQVLDVQNQLICTYAYVGGGLGVGLTAIANTYVGPWEGNDFQTSQPIAVTQFGGLARFSSAGGGNLTWNWINLLGTPSGVDSVYMMMNTGTTLGLGISTTVGDFICLDDGEPFTGP